MFSKTKKSDSANNPEQEENEVGEESTEEELINTINDEDRNNR